MTDDEDMQPSVTSRDMSPVFVLKSRTRNAFMLWLAERTKLDFPAYICTDPGVTYNGDEDEFYLRFQGSSLSFAGNSTRQLRQLATQLELVADEMERRGFER